MKDDAIFDILKSCFKSLNRNTLHSLTKAIVCVALGLRASHLIDVTFIDLDKAKILQRKLSKIFPSLILVQFKDRFTFLCNKHRLKQHLDSTLKEPTKWIYVAVDKAEPVKHDLPPSLLITWLREKLLSFLNSNQALLYSPILPTYLVAITGWFLEYPVIYTTHASTDDPEDEMDEWETRPNCLGSQTLNLFQVWLADHMLLSFTCPSIIKCDHLVDLLQSKYDARLLDLRGQPDWLKIERCTINTSQVKLDRFAL